MEFTEWDFYEVISGYRVYRDQLHTGSWELKRQYKQICKTKKEAAAICELLNLQNIGGN